MMKEISSIVMDWVTFLGGMNVIWCVIASAVAIQVSIVAGINTRNMVAHRLTPYVVGAVCGAALLGTSTAKAVVIGFACGGLAAGAFAAVTLWLCRDAATGWQKKLGAYLRGKSC